jgi:hypothetical protein
MASEAKRGCGYRKVGGIYLCADAPNAPCCKLPIEFHVCPTCNSGVKQTRGFQWIDPRPWLKGACIGVETARLGQSGPFSASLCPAANPDTMGDKVGLLWIGEQFYPTPDSFLREARELGVSRRVKGVPRGFKLGEHYVFLAHPRVKELLRPGEKPEWIGGIFQIFRPTRIEKIITQSQARDAEEMDKLSKAGITPVVVDDNDRDHQGTPYDKDEPATPAL